MQLHASALGVGVVTAQVLVAAPGAGFRITVLGFALSTTIAGTVSMLSSTNAANTKQFLLGANGHAESQLARWELEDNAALEITTSAAGPTSVEVDYIIEKTV